MDKLKKLMMKKAQEGKTLDPMEAKAKTDVLDNLVDDMLSMGGDKLDGIKKVTVAGSDPSAIEKGLDKAKEMVAQTEKLEDEAEEAGEEMAEMEEGEDMMDDEMSPEEIEAKIAELKAKLGKMKA